MQPSSSSVIRTRRQALLAGCFLALMLPAGLDAQPGSSLFGGSRFLPVDQAFSYYTSLDSDSQISIHWTIAPGYYLYADKFSVSVSSPESESGELAFELPAGVAHNDEYFGDVTVFYDSLRISLQLPQALTAGTEDIVLQLDYQVCAEAGLCYPPESRQIPIYR